MPQDQSTQNRKAKWLMLSSVFLFSFTPLLFHIGDAGAAPLLIGLAVEVVFIAACAVAVFLMFGKIKEKHQSLKDKTISDVFVYLRPRAGRRKEILFASIAGLDYPFFAYSLKYLDDIAVATILFETWPIFTILIFSYFIGKRYKKPGIGDWFLIAIAFAGVALVIASQTTNISHLGALSWKGLLLVIIAALCASLRAYSASWGHEAARKAKKRIKGEKTFGFQEDLFFTIAAAGMSHIPCCFLIFMGFLAFGIGVESPPSLLITLSCATAVGVTSGGAAILFRYANNLSNNPGVNVLSYLTPVLSLALFFGGGYVSVPHVDRLIVGFIGIVTANSLINYKANVRLGYKALVVSLWGSGAMVYFIGTDAKLIGHYEAIAIVSTIFILILSFRTDRMVRRDTAEDEMFVHVWRLLPYLIHKDNLKKAQNALTIMSAATLTADRKEAYKALRSFVKPADKSDKGLISELERKIDDLAHSKQQGRNFAETIALSILAAVTVWGLLSFSPPDIAGIAGFYINMSSFLLASTIVFLLFNVWDLQKDREQVPMRRYKESKEDGEIRFYGDEDKKPEQNLSIAVCLSIILTYGVLFWLRWEVFGNA